MKSFFAPAVLLGLMTLSPASSDHVAAATVNALFSAQVEENEIDPFIGAVDQAFFNVQGDNDNFTVYSLVDFDGAAFGLTGLTPGQIGSISFSIAQSNAGFSLAGPVDYFLATDTREVTLSDTARYLQAGTGNPPNIGAQVVGDAFGTLYALGTGDYEVVANGDIDTFAFTLDAAGEAFLIGQLNSGGLIRIIGTPGNVDVQATYSGAQSILQPTPIPPSLTITAVPEPATFAVLGVVGCGLSIARRRRSGA